mmetsp:Transcript_74902/g.163499  ORF Transcript_74902/g.163499 Transcript_74902/m.163499 type:complete len:259 (+) Transcript_74902:87-863(+)
MQARDAPHKGTDRREGASIRIRFVCKCSWSNYCVINILMQRNSPTVHHRLGVLDQSILLILTSFFWSIALVLVVRSSSSGGGCRCRPLGLLERLNDILGRNCPQIANQPLVVREGLLSGFIDLLVALSLALLELHLQPLSQNFVALHLFDGCGSTDAVLVADKAEASRSTSAQLLHNFRANDIPMRSKVLVQVVVCPIVRQVKYKQIAARRPKFSRVLLLLLGALLASSLALLIGLSSAASVPIAATIAVLATFAASS